MLRLWLWSCGLTPREWKLVNRDGLNVPDLNIYSYVDTITIFFED